MKPEEFEVYVIPPNFMEGGTLFGGLLKTRNTIEAVILGLAVGVPVLHLPFSLTVRVVILCLTALPLVLLALIGVSASALHEGLTPTAWSAGTVSNYFFAADTAFRRWTSRQQSKSCYPISQSRPGSLGLLFLVQFCKEVAH